MKNILILFTSNKNILIWYNDNQLILTQLAEICAETNSDIVNCSRLFSQASENVDETILQSLKFANYRIISNYFIPHGF